MSNLRVPEKKTLATALDLTAAYAKIGSALNIVGGHGVSLELEETANTENASMKFFFGIDGSQPSSSTDLYQAVDAAGAELECVVTQNTKKMYTLPFAAKWFLMEGKGAAGTDADLNATATSNFTHKNRSRVHNPPVTIAGVATALTGSYAALGNIISISGLSNLSLYVDNSAGTGSATFKIFTESTSNAKPSSLSNFYTEIAAGGSDKTFVTLSGEKAVHNLGNLSSRWLGLQGLGSNASVKVYLVGSPAGI